mmetsp:Transcript_46985/g.56813  ORF Transcript_46985/g.56813 Transcript_46985/m.56813 type:complete len:230 (+) Transcript_46985:117-806(+)
MLSSICHKPLQVSQKILQGACPPFAIITVSNRQPSNGVLPLSNLLNRMRRRDSFIKSRRRNSGIRQTPQQPIKSIVKVPLSKDLKTIIRKKIVTGSAPPAIAQNGNFAETPARRNRMRLVFNPRRALLRQHDEQQSHRSQPRVYFTPRYFKLIVTLRRGCRGGAALKKIHPPQRTGRTTDGSGVLVGGRRGGGYRWDVTAQSEAVDGAVAPRVPNVEAVVGDVDFSNER